MTPYVARKDAASAWYIVTPGSPKPFALQIPKGGITASIRALQAVDYGDLWDAFLTTVTVIKP